MAADNGPKVIPAPPGPTPHGAYEYLLVPRPKPVPPNAPWYAAFKDFQQIESEVIVRGASADRLDLSDGRRVYRVLTQYLWKFDHDINGCFIGRYPMPVFRFLLDDPSTGLGVIDEWEPI